MLENSRDSLAFGMFAVLAILTKGNGFALAALPLFAMLRDYSLATLDAAKSAALAVTMLDWRDFGQAYADEMIAMAQANGARVVLVI